MKRISSRNVKRLLIAFLLLWMSPEIHAQETSIKKNALLISPFGLLAGKYNKIRIRYEHLASNNFAYGVDFKYYFPKEYPGFQILPFMKYFFIDDSEGPYFYMTGVYGQNQHLPPERTKYTSCYGVGAGVGLQYFMGMEKNGMFDISIGMKYVITDAKFGARNPSSNYDDYFFIGPGAIIDGILAVGFRF